jgi:hypothetical protein
MHTVKKEIRITKKERSYNDIFPETAALTPLRHHQKSSFSKNDAFKREQCTSAGPIIDLRFSL